MKKENMVILYGCLNDRTEKEEIMLKNLLKEKLDWGYICGQLIHHRIGGYFYINMGEKINSMLFDPRKTLDILVKAQDIIANERYIVMSDICDIFERESIHYAALKGLVYGMTIYALGARRSNDCDILVWEDDLEKVDNILKNEGFIQSLDGGKTQASRREILIQRMNYHDTVSYYKKINSQIDEYIKIDVNFHFDNKNNDITKKVLDYGTRLLEKKDYKIRALLPSTHFLHLCAHFYREGSDVLWTSSLRDVSLYKIIDCINTFRSMIDEEVFECIQIADKFHLNEAMYYTLYYMRIFYDDPKLDVLMEKIDIKDNAYLNEVRDKNTILHRSRQFIDRAFDMSYCIEKIENV